MVERKIRHLQEIIGVDAVLWRKRDANAGTNADNLAIDAKGSETSPIMRAASDLGSVALGDIVDLDDGEFIAPEPRQYVGFPQCPFNSLSHLPEQFVTGGMSECVVNLLESIEVDHEDIEFFIPSTTTCARVFDFFHQSRTIGQTQ